MAADIRGSGRFPSGMKPEMAYSTVNGSQVRIYAPIINPSIFAARRLLLNFDTSSSTVLPIIITLIPSAYSPPSLSDCSQYSAISRTSAAAFGRWRRTLIPKNKRSGYGIWGDGQNSNKSEKLRSQGQFFMILLCFHKNLK